MKGKKVPDNQAEFWERMYRAEYDARVRLNEQIGALKFKAEEADKAAAYARQDAKRWEQEACRLDGYRERVRETDKVHPSREDVT